MVRALRHMRQLPKWSLHGYSGYRLWRLISSSQHLFEGDMLLVEIPFLGCFWNECLPISRYVLSAHVYHIPLKVVDGNLFHVHKSIL